MNSPTISPVPSIDDQLAILARRCERIVPEADLRKKLERSYKTGKPLENASVRLAIKSAEQKLNGHGRLVIRPSGTEPVIRVMAEGDNKSLVEDAVDSIVEALSGVAA